MEPPGHRGPAADRAGPAATRASCRTFSHHTMEIDDTPTLRAAASAWGNLTPRACWAILCIDSAVLAGEGGSRRNPFRDSDVVLDRVGTDVAGAQARIEANAVLLPRAGRGPMNLKLKFHKHMHVQWFIAIAGLGVGLVAFGGVAMAQEGTAPVINADGSSGTSNAGVNPAVDADGPTLVYGDIDSPPGTTVIGPPAPISTDVVYAPPPGTTGDITATNGDAAALGPTGDASAAPGSVTGGSGTALLGPDGTYTVTEVSPSNVSVGDSGALAPAPVYDPALEPAPEYVAAPVETTAPVAADDPSGAAVASAEDLDGDNYIDALELEVGLDPNNPDADGDGVADGDEVNIYFTDPWVWDTDGDGLSDGEELFGVLTDPLVWDTNGDGLGDAESVAV